MGRPGEEGEEPTLPVDVDGPLAALVFKTVVDPYAGKISLIRVFSGKVHGDQIYNGSKGSKERFGQLAQVMGKNLKSVAEVTAGDFGAMTKLKETATGDSLCDEKGAFLLPEINFLKPVISVAVAPKSKGDEDKLSTALSRLKDADAALRVSLDPQTKEMIIATMGQQHIEIVVGRLTT